MISAELFDKDIYEHDYIRYILGGTGITVRVVIIPAVVGQAMCRMSPIANRFPLGQTGIWTKLGFLDLEKMRSCIGFAWPGFGGTWDLGMASVRSC